MLAFLNQYKSGRFKHHMINQQSKRNREIASYILSGSTTMTGVCITIITLFRILKTNLQTIADEVIGINTFVFISAALFAYLALRKENNAKLERVADILFFTGMIVTFFVGIIIVFTAY